MYKLNKDARLNATNLSARTNNALNNAGIETVGELLEYPLEEIPNIKNLGMKNADEVMVFISKIKKEERIDSKIDEEETFQTSGENIKREENKQKIIDVCHSVVEGLRPYAGRGYHGGKLQNELVEFCSEDKNYKTIIKEINGFKGDNVLANQNLIQLLVFYPMVRTVVKDCIGGIAKTEEYGVSRNTILTSMPKYFDFEELVDKLIDEMLTEGKLVNVFDNRYTFKYDSIMNFVGLINKDRDRKIMMERINGKTLLEVGESFQLSRERVRQIAQRYLDIMDRVYEDIYRDVFMKYHFTKENFVLGFEVPETTFNYLCIKYRSGKIEPEFLIDDETFPERFRKAGEKIVYKNHVTIGNELVIARRLELCEYILRNVGKEGITFKELVKHYNKLIDDLEIDNNDGITLMGRGYENKISSSNKVLWKYGKKFRYYNIDAYDFTNLLNELDLGKYKDVEYSALKFFRKYEELMEEYDIRDEYELHNLLKKICKKKDYPNIKFSRMPNIIFGEANREKQVMDLLKSLCPIQNYEFGKIYEEVYGVRVETVLANYMKGFEKYFFNGEYKMDFPIPDKKTIDKLKSVFNEEYYSLNTINEIYKEKLPDIDSSYINSYTINLLGFHVYSDYAISKEYTSAKEYFRKVLTGNDTVDISSLPKDLKTNIGFSSELYKLRTNYEIVEYKRFQYINIRALSKRGVNRVAIEQYCKSVIDYVKEGEYFTIHSLILKGFKHILHDLDYNECFFASLLGESPLEISYRRIGGNKLFKKGEGEVTADAFIHYIMTEKSLGCIKIQKLVEIMLSEYNIDFNLWKIPETVKGSQLYYDTFTKEIYINYEAYEMGCRDLENK